MFEVQIFVSSFYGKSPKYLFLFSMFTTFAYSDN